MRLSDARLECISQAELVLPFGGIRRAFAGDFSKCAAGWVYIRIVQVGMVHVVEGLGLEDQLVVFMVRYEMKSLLHRGIEALEAGAINNIERRPRRKRADRR